jgi:hypothetical protein
MSRRKRLAALTLLSAAAVAIVAAVHWSRPRPPAPPASEADLAARLQVLGYHVHVEPADHRTPEGRLVLAGCTPGRTGQRHGRMRRRRRRGLPSGGGGWS